MGRRPHERVGEVFLGLGLATPQGLLGTVHRVERAQLPDDDLVRALVEPPAAGLTLRHNSDRPRIAATSTYPLVQAHPDLRLRSASAARTAATPAAAPATATAANRIQTESRPAWARSRMATSG